MESKIDQLRRMARLKLAQSESSKCISLESKSTNYRLADDVPCVDLRSPHYRRTRGSKFPESSEEPPSGTRDYASLKRRWIVDQIRDFELVAEYITRF